MTEISQPNRGGVGRKRRLTPLGICGSVFLVAGVIVGVAANWVIPEGRYATYDHDFGETVATAYGWRFWGIVGAVTGATILLSFGVWRLVQRMRSS